MSYSPGKYSVSQLAVELGVDRRTLAKRLELAGIDPAGTKGRAKLYRIKDARTVIEGHAPAEKKTGESESAARARLTRARADIHEATASQLSGDLIPADAVEKAWGQILSGIRGHLVALPDRAAPQVEDAGGLNEIREILRDAVAEILTEMSDTEVVFEEPKPNGSTGNGRPDHDPSAPRPTPRRPRSSQAAAPAAPA